MPVARSEVVIDGVEMVYHVRIGGVVFFIYFQFQMEKSAGMGEG